MVDFKKLGERMDAERRDPLLKLLRLSRDLAAKALKSEKASTRYDGQELLESCEEIEKWRRDGGYEP